jgi:transposase
VLDRGYTQEEAAMVNVGKSTVSKWESQLKVVRDSVASKELPMTPKKIEIRELKREIERIKLEKEILKKKKLLLY